MHVDVRPGQRIRLGPSLTLTVLSARASVVRFALEGAEPVPGSPGKFVREGIAIPPPGTGPDGRSGRSPS
jgi:hypothetical protein